MKTLILLILLSFSLQSFAPCVSLEIQKQRIEVFLYEKWKTDVFLEVIEEIKHAEGLVLNKYKCSANQNTIGYGHWIRPGENYHVITEEKATELLIKDFKEAFSYTDSNLPYNKRLAVAKFIFNIGIGKYNKSKLKTAILHGESIDNLIVQYCHYKSDGKYVKSDWLLNQRLFELKIWNNDYKS